MSLFRVPLSRSWARVPSNPSIRRYATTNTTNKPSNLPFYLLGVGALSAGGYYYLNAQAIPKQEKSPLDPDNFIDFKLKKVLPYNHNTSKFVFQLPNNEAALTPVASFILVRASDPDASALKDDKGRPIIRPYTPISAPDEKGELTLLVKKYDTGNASKHIHSLKEGDTLALKGPIVKFPYQHNEFDEIALIGGGSGITPLYQILTHALKNSSNTTKFKLLYSNVSEADILLRDELDALQRKHPNTLEVVYIVDKAKSADWKGPTGYITKDLIEKHITPAAVDKKVKFFICGPPAQVASIAGKKDGMKQGELGGILKELGYQEGQVFKF